MGKVDASSVYYTSHIASAVLLRRDREDKVDPVTIPAKLKMAAVLSPQHPALVYQTDQGEKIKTYSEYYRDVRTVAQSFISLGLSRFDTVCIYARNSVEWVISDQAAIAAGGVAIGIYPTSQGDACAHIIRDSKCKIIVVEGLTRYQTLLKIEDQVEDLTHIVLICTEDEYSSVTRDVSPKPRRAKLVAFSELYHLGSEEEEKLELRLQDISANTCAKIVYTSGTTGAPVGAMLSHDNLTYAARVNCRTYSFQEEGERFLSFLPLSHILANIIDVHIIIEVRGTVYFADEGALKPGSENTLKQNLEWCRPTAVMGVPRVWEKIQAQVEAKIEAYGRLGKLMFDCCGKIARDFYGDGPLGYLIYPLRYSYFYMLKRIIGLECSTHLFSAGAPLQQSTFQFFLGLDILLLECYGMSETSGGHICQAPGQIKFGTTGKPLPTYRMDLREPEDDSVKCDKEIVLYGRNVMMGYLHNAAKNCQTFTQDNYIKSGDLGRMDEDGFVSLVGRCKDIIITAGGENIPIVPIEDMIKAMLGVLSHAVLVGDRRQFVSVLLTLKVEVDPVSLLPTTNLAQEAVQWCQERGIQASTVQEFKQSALANQAIYQGLEAVNQAVNNKAHSVRRFSILPSDLSDKLGDFTPTLKIKRYKVIEKYAQEINQIYEV